MTDSVSQLSQLPKKSRYTYRQLAQLSKYSTDTPLRVVAHIDLDAFYAQCEVVRLGLSGAEPLAVQQWQSLIAVNYPAREFGISRLSTAVDALKLCPNLKLVHVATWREGDIHWEYRENPSIASCKACLDPYRSESKKILSIFQDACPRVEKASIDESFLDLSVMIHERLLTRYPNLTLPPPYSDPTENLPLPPQEVELGWGGSHLLELGEECDETVDWDDVGMAIAAEIVNEIRGKVKEKLGYTCSAGIAQNKLLAKLGSGYKKPNQQTVVRSGAAQRFLNSFKFTKLRNLGGKFGTQISEGFNTEQLVDLLDIPLNQLQSKLDDDAATWVYNIIRGIDKSEVNPRVQMKSMLSAKSFRPTITTFDQAHKWLVIFISDIYSRLEEEGVMEGKTRPKTMTLAHKATNGGGKTRQVPIPLGRPLTKEGLMSLAEGLLKGIESEGKVYPCVMLSLQVAGFEERETGNMGIAGFLVKGDLARATKKEQAEGQQEEDRTAKRRRVGGGIGKFFRKGSDDPETGDLNALELEDHLEQSEDMMDIEGAPSNALERGMPSSEAQPVGLASNLPSHYTYTCSRCKTEISIENQEEHEDWHFAKQLADEDRAAARGRISAASTSLPSVPGDNSKKGNAAKKGSGSGGKASKKGAGMEKGQRKLAFGS